MSYVDFLFQAIFWGGMGGLIPSVVLALWSDTPALDIECVLEIGFVWALVFGIPALVFYVIPR